MKYRIFLLLLLIPMSVSANTILDIECKEEKNNLYKCEVIGNFEYEVSAIDFHYSLPENTELKEYSLSNNWLGDADDNWLSLYSDENFIGKTPIITLMIESKNNLKSEDILIQDLLLYDADFKEHKIENDVKIDENKQTLTIIEIICAIIVVGIILLTMIILVIKRLNRRGDLK